MVWDTTRLEALSGDQLWQLFENCQQRGTAEAKGIANLIVGILSNREKLSVGETGVKLDSPFGKLMTWAVNSAESKSAGLDATNAGLPAMAGVEPILVREFGDAYAKRYEATIQAGYLVAKMMRSIGYRTTGNKGAMPDGSVAKTAEIYEWDSFI